MTHVTPKSHFARPRARTYASNASYPPNASPVTAKKPKARILQRTGAHSCPAKHEWVLPWPMAAVRQCARCHAWLVPSEGRRHHDRDRPVQPAAVPRQPQYHQRREIMTDRDTPPPERRAPSHFSDLTGPVSRHLRRAALREVERWHRSQQREAQWEGKAVCANDHNAHSAHRAPPPCHSHPAVSCSTSRFRATDPRPAQSRRGRSTAPLRRRRNPSLLA